MDRILKVVGWVGFAVLGLVVWTVFPEAQTVIACFLAATLIFYVFFAAVKATVRQIVGDQLMELPTKERCRAPRPHGSQDKCTSEECARTTPNKPKRCDWSSAKATACCATTVCLTSQSPCVCH